MTDTPPEKPQEGDTAPPAPPAPPAPYTGPERRVELGLWRAHVDRRLDDGAAKMASMYAELIKNTKTTEDVQTNTSELVSLLQSFKGAFVVFDMLGKAAKPMSYIAMCFSALWGLFSVVKGGGKQ